MSRCITKPWNYSLIPGTFRSYYNEEIPYLWKVNLRDLWTCKPSDFPECPEDNVIYCIHNDKNNKCYVGQTHNLIDRFHIYGWSHLENYINGVDTILYRAINKYGASLFTVYVLDELNYTDQLNDKEIYWISRLKSCILKYPRGGYNMNFGGGNADHLHTKSVINKRVKTMIEEYGDPMGACNSPEAINKILKRYNGDRCGMLHTPEVITKRMKSAADEYNGDPYGMLHTSEALQHRLNTVSLMYNGDSMGQCHTEEAIVKAATNNSLTKLYEFIISICEVLDREHLEYNAINYWHWCGTTSSIMIKHFHRVFNHIDDPDDPIHSDPRFTPKIMNIFYELIEYRNDLYSRFNELENN